MEIKEDTKLVTTTSFTFTPEEAVILADIVGVRTDWETYEHGEHFDFLYAFTAAMEDVYQS